MLHVDDASIDGGIGNSSLELETQQHGIERCAKFSIQLRAGIARHAAC